MDPVAEYMQTDQKNKKDKFVYLNRLAKKGQILFAGSSLMEQFPVNESDKLPEGEWAAHLFDTRNNENIRRANEAVEKLAQEMGCRFLDVSAGLSDGSGKLKKEYTVEGIHLYANAYDVILDNLLPVFETVSRGKL